MAEREEALAAVSEWLAETTLGRDGLGRHRQGIASAPEVAAASWSWWASLWAIRRNSGYEYPVKKA